MLYTNEINISPIALILPALTAQGGINKCVSKSTLCIPSQLTLSPLVPLAPGGPGLPGGPYKEVKLREKSLFLKCRRNKVADIGSSVMSCTVQELTEHMSLLWLCSTERKENNNGDATAAIIRSIQFQLVQKNCSSVSISASNTKFNIKFRHEDLPPSKCLDMKKEEMLQKTQFL